MSSDYEFTQDHSLYQPKKRRSLPIPDDEWDRLKKLIRDLSLESRIYQTLGSISLAISGTAGLSLLGFTTAESVADWVWIAAWVMFVAPAGIGAVCLNMDHREGQRTRTSTEWIVGEMERLEDQYEPPPAEPGHGEKGGAGRSGGISGIGDLIVAGPTKGD